MRNELSNREKEILALILAEYTTRQIARILHLSFETIRTHRKNMMNKFKARNVVGLVKQAYENKMIGEFDHTVRESLNHVEKLQLSTC